MRHLSVLLCVLPALVAVAPAGSLAQDAPPDELRQFAEDTYAFVSGGYVSLFIVTDEGVIATDPGSKRGPERAEAYEAAIASVTERPVRNLI